MKHSAPLHGPCSDQDILLALDIILSLDIAILKRVGPRNYAFYGKVPSFYTSIFPAAPDGGPCNSPWEYSSMLEFFLEDAELFFERGIPGKIISGIWQEEDLCENSQALSATAIVVGDTKAVIIRLLEDDFANRARILQKAREQLLEQRSLNRDLETYKNKSRFDGLTSLLNRPTFMDILHKETTRSMTLGMDLSMLFMDIDNFKEVNDTYGHLAGDYVLTSLAKALQQSLRSDDVIARYGGEEFAVLAPFTTPGQAQMMAEKLRKSVEAMDLGDIRPVTISIGCTAYVGGESVESFLQRADMALYDAKRAGKNRVRIR